MAPEWPVQGVPEIAQHAQELGVNNRDADRGTINRLAAPHCLAVDLKIASPRCHGKLLAAIRP